MGAFETLFPLNVGDHIEKKKTGGTELSYLSWSWAWAEVKKRFPDASYTIVKFGDNGCPYFYDPLTGYMVYTTVTIEGITHEMWLPVMDGANKAMKAEPYTYIVKSYNKQVEKTVAAATMFDINKAIMRCLVKNLAMFGLGLYIYSGEDLPEDPDPDPQPTQKAAQNTETKKAAPKVDRVSDRIGDLKAKALESELSKNGILVDTVYGLYHVTKLADLSEKQHKNVYDNIARIKELQDGRQGRTG